MRKNTHKKMGPKQDLRLPTNVRKWGGGGKNRLRKKEMHQNLKKKTYEAEKVDGVRKGAHEPRPPRGVRVVVESIESPAGNERCETPGGWGGGR